MSDGDTNLKGKLRIFFDRDGKLVNAVVIQINGVELDDDNIPAAVMEIDLTKAVSHEDGTCWFYRQDEFARMRPAFASERALKPLQPSMPCCIQLTDGVEHLTEHLHTFFNVLNRGLIETLQQGHAVLRREAGHEDNLPPLTEEDMAAIQTPDPMNITVVMGEHEYIAEICGTRSDSHELVQFGTGRSVDEAVGNLLQANKAAFDVKDVFLDDGLCTCDKCHARRKKTTRPPSTT